MSVFDLGGLEDPAPRHAGHVHERVTHDVPARVHDPEAALERHAGPDNRRAELHLRDDQAVGQCDARDRDRELPVRKALRAGRVDVGLGAARHDVPVVFETAWLAPSESVAATRTRSFLPMSAAWPRYVLLVAPAMPTQLAPFTSQRCHCSRR